MAETQVAGLYSRLKSKVVGFDIRPGERLNEVALARELGVSRTPLREALNRLVAERLVEFRPGAGFFCRMLEPQAIFDLYEMRQVLEVTAVRLAVVRASDEELIALRDEFRQRGQDVTGLTIAQAAERDEAFHIGIARASGNAAGHKGCSTIRRLSGCLGRGRECWHGPFARRSPRAWRRTDRWPRPCRP